MTPDRWQQVERVYHAALERDPASRPAYIDEACSGDPELRQEVETLLAAHQEGDGFLETPAIEVMAFALADQAPRFEPGRQIGTYQLVSLLGAGGMGEVWRARDTALGRDVAIKVLPAVFSRDSDRLRRFEHEAHAAGMLNHPNVLSVYAMGTEEGAPYVVSELLEGDTLRDRLRDGSLPLRKALDIAIQVARGLAAAHEKEIAHRDLKPANLFVTRDGRAKILDFGVAKFTRPEPVGDHRATACGVIVGTAGYMAPEQARGQTVDHRADLFALGAILYEMLAGRPAFPGDTAVELMNAVLPTDPPPIPGMPPHVDRIVRRCLEKNPEERFQSARDLAFGARACAPDGPRPVRLGIRA
jgi:serine/threonine protein kinase